MEWKAGLLSLGHPNAKTYSTLHSSWAHQRVQPDISMQRNLLSKPIRYTDVKWEKFQSGKGEITHSWENSEVSTVLCCSKEPWSLPLPENVTWTCGAARSQVLGRIFAMNNTSHLRLCDNTFLKNRTPQTKSVQNSHWGVIYFWKVTKVIGEESGHKTCKVRVSVRSRGTWHRWGQVSSAYPIDAFELRVQILLPVVLSPVLGLSLWP